MGYRRFWHGTGRDRLHCSGFEFDYTGVIFGNDLAYDPDQQVWISRPENLHDSHVKCKNAKLTQHLKNLYRVLLSRAHRGVYAYFMDRSTEHILGIRFQNPEIGRPFFLAASVVGG